MTTTNWIASAAAVITAVATVTLAPPAYADPDPHIPNGEANWCPGGQRSGQGNTTKCLGTPFPDGSFYAQSWSFGAASPGSWHNFAVCSAWDQGDVVYAFPDTAVFSSVHGDCGGGPPNIPLSN